jgi:hypothetical protein
MRNQKQARTFLCKFQQWWISLDEILEKGLHWYFAFPRALVFRRFGRVNPGIDKVPKTVAQYGFRNQRISFADVTNSHDFDISLGKLTI